MLRLVAEDESDVEPDTDFEFLADSEEAAGDGLRTAGHYLNPVGRAWAADLL